MTTGVMLEGEGRRVGRDWASGQTVVVSWSSGVIDAVEPVGEGGAAENTWLAPGLVDLQVNGFGGVDFQDPDVSFDQLKAAVVRLRERGCGALFLTLITDRWEQMLAKLQRLVSLRDASPFLREAIVGWHLEGPFLSVEEGYRGAHDPAFMRDPLPGDLSDLLSVVGEDRVLMTVAPERPGVLELIEAGVSKGLQFSLGHCAAQPDQLAAAIQAGARGITHWGNGIPQSLPRHDNWFWTIIDQAGLHVGLIPDGIHLPPTVFRGMHAALRGSHEIYYTTDAMAAGGAGPGRYKLAGQSLEVGTDRVVRIPGQPNFAGSSLDPLDGVCRASQMLGVSWREAWERFSLASTRFVGLDWGLVAGAPACFCEISVGEGQEIDQVIFYDGRSDEAR